MYFYTTASQETDLRDIYENALRIKQDELDEEYKKTQRIQKFTAYGHVYRPERVFYVKDDVCYYGRVSPKTRCPDHHVSGGQTYTFDKKFTNQINEFCKKHTSYKVVFKPDGKYGPCMNYNGSIGCMPAYLESDQGGILEADDDDAYDIGCA